MPTLETSLISTFRLESYEIEDIIEKIQGDENFYKKIFENIDGIFYQLELILWALLYIKNKEKVRMYEGYIYELIEKLKEKIANFIPEENFLSENEEKEVKRIFSDCLIVGY